MNLNFITLVYFLKLVVDGRTDGRTDRQTDGPTDMGTYRADIAAKNYDTVVGGRAQDICEKTLMAACVGASPCHVFHPKLVEPSSYQNSALPALGGKLGREMPLHRQIRTDTEH